MLTRTLGRTGLQVPVVSFGAGPVSGLMTGTDAAAQRATVGRALAAGIDWFDTAPGYGQGQSEATLGRVLAELGTSRTARIATKVRVPEDALGRVGDYVLSSVRESLARLRVQQITLLQLHNGIARGRGDEPAALTSSDVLDAGGVLDAFRRVRDAGLVRYLGLTGTGHADAMREVIRSGGFDTLQVPYNLLNSSAGRAGAADGEIDYGNVIADATAVRMGVFAIRVFAGGALLDQPPSAHTLTTPYFPLALYRRDVERARRVRELVGDRMTAAELALRFVLANPAVTSAIVGFGSPGHIDEVARVPLDERPPADLAGLS
ncbi:MAG TPA: aldo/keto reductase [Gemmataceae bacterium]|nr:aldo/keto reductase [Gemmataceae bacterium]